MRIAYVLESLAYSGGVERIISEKANYLADREGYDVSVIVCYGFSEPVSNVYFLSSKVRRFSLDIPYHSQYRYGYPRRLWEKWKLNRLLNRRLEDVVLRIAPDIILCPSCNFADIVCRLSTKAVKIVESHEARLFTKSERLYSHSALSGFFMRLYRKLYMNTIERKADVVVTLTKGDASEWRKAKRVEIIPNFTLMTATKTSDGSQKRAIAVGRLGWQKGFDRLISIWQVVSEKHPDWHLDIYGTGALEQELKQTIHKAGLASAVIHPFNPDISSCYAESSVFLLTSRFEGFGLVLIEAMRHGLPCVVFDCCYGPSEIVVNDSTGYVVANGDLQGFADKVCRLIEEPETRAAFSVAALRRSEMYNADTVMQRWMNLFDSLV